MFKRKSAAAGSADVISIASAKETGSVDGETLLTMLDNMPINVMMADPVDLKINYINKTSVETLKTVRDLLPQEVDPENMIGVCIDVFTNNHPTSAACWLIQEISRTVRRLSWGRKPSISMYPQSMTIRALMSVRW